MASHRKPVFGILKSHFTINERISHFSDRTPSERVTYPEQDKPNLES